MEEAAEDATYLVKVILPASEVEWLFLLIPRLGVEVGAEMLGYKR